MMGEPALASGGERPDAAAVSKAVLLALGSALAGSLIGYSIGRSGERPASEVWGDGRPDRDRVLSALGDGSGGEIRRPRGGVGGRGRGGVDLEELGRKFGSMGAGAPMRAVQEVRAAMLDLTEEQIPEVLEMIESEHGVQSDYAAMTAFFSRWGEFDRAAALRYLDDGPQEMRGPGLHAVVSSWAVDEPRAAMAYIESMPMGDERSTTREVAFAALATSDPKQAIEIARRSGSTAERERYFQMIAGKWAMDSPAEALAWVEGFSDGAVREKLLPRLVQGWAMGDPRGALDYALAQEDTELLQHSGRGILQRWARADLMGAFDYLVANREVFGEPGNDVLQSIGWAAGSLGEDELEDLIRRVPDENGRNSLIAGLASSAIGRDPGEAAEIAAGLSEGAQREQTLARVADAWARADAPAASEWLFDLLPGKSREEAVASFSRVLTASDPENAAAWAASLSDDDQREKVLSEIANRWLAKDRPAAEAWLSGAGGLSDEKKAELLGRP